MWIVHCKVQTRAEHVLMELGIDPWADKHAKVWSSLVFVGPRLIGRQLPSQFDLILDRSILHGEVPSFDDNLCCHHRSWLDVKIMSSRKYDISSLPLMRVADKCETGWCALAKPPEKVLRLPQAGNGF